MAKVDLSVAIGGAAGQGIATPGDILARIFVRRGLHLNAYNAYQSIVRGGHIFLTLRTSDEPVLSFGDKLDVMIPLNQDTMNRHLGLMKAGSAVLYNGDKIKPAAVAPGVQLCPFSVKELAPSIKGDLVQNTIALAAVLQLIGVEFKILEDILSLQFKRKGEAVIAENVGVARAGYEYAAKHFKALPFSLPETGKPLAFFEGNQALAMGGAAAGVRFYCAYPMSPSSGVLHWMARHARQLGIMVRQVEDEIGVINMAIGAAHVGCRAMCATSGGGFALMTEGLGAAAMMEIPLVCINVQRAGPATGVPTKTEQGDLWQVMGAGQGDLSSHHRRADKYLGLFQDRATIIQPGGQVSVSWYHPVGSVAFRRPLEHRPGGIGFQRSHRARRGDRSERLVAAAQWRIQTLRSSPKPVSLPARCRGRRGSSMSWQQMTMTKMAC